MLNGPALLESKVAPLDIRQADKPIYGLKYLNEVAYRR